MAQRTPVPDGHAGYRGPGGPHGPDGPDGPGGPGGPGGIVDVALWRGGVGDGAEARRASSLYVAMFLLWPLAAVAAGLVSLLLSWVGRGAAQAGFLVTFGAGLVAPFLWQWWEASAWRMRRRATRAGGFVPVCDLSALAVLADGQPVRVRGRVRARTRFAAAGAPVGTAGDRVYEQVRARAGRLGPELWYELGCDFEVVDIGDAGDAGDAGDLGHAADAGAGVDGDRDARPVAVVHLAMAQVLPRRGRRVRLRGRDVIERVLGRLPVGRAVAAALADLTRGRMAARVRAIHDGDEVEILACKLPPDGRAVLHRESALRPALGGYAGIMPLVVVRDQGAAGRRAR